MLSPPLYRVKSGKHVQYVKDDKHLNDYLVQIALEEAKLVVNPSAPPIHGMALERLAKQYLQVMDIIARLSYRYPSLVLEALLYAPKLTPAVLQDKARMENWLGLVQQELDKIVKEGTYFQLQLGENKERQAYLPDVRMTTHGVESFYHFTYEFFLTQDYQNIMGVGAEIAGLLEPDAYVERGGKKLSVTSFKEALAWLMEEAKRGQQISRYKGLGEMNPEQLWETTMDPAIRHMLVVKIEDAISADQIFTTLMGDNVESRREFIEANALLAANIDI